MKNFKSHFAFNRSQRNGIFLLVVLIVVLQMGYFFLDFSSEETLDPEQQEKITLFQQRIDSLKQVASEEEPFEIFPFNPNFISDHKGYTLGMSLEEIDKLQAYRAEGKWVNSIKEFQKVTDISDSLLQMISPFFRFPEWVEQQNTSRAESQKAAVPVAVQDLNKVSAETLQSINGVGEVLSGRIVRYREKIGGFRGNIQLKDVYGLAPDVVDRITQRFVVLEPELERQDLNEIPVIALSEIPYFNYELAREIVDFRKLREKIKSFDELSQITGFPFKKIDRIKLYLTIN